MSICLDVQELQELTGKIRPSAQRRALNAMGIDCRRRPDGTVVVLRSAVDQTKAKKRSTGPDFGAINHVA